MVTLAQIHIFLKRSAIATLGAYCLTTASLLPAKDAPTAQQSQRFTLADVSKLQWATDPQISADGKRIAFVREAFNMLHNATDSSVWMIDVDTKRLRQISELGAKAAAVAWAPDGKRLAYVATHGTGGDRVTRLLAYNVDSATTSELAQTSQAPSRLSWSPDGLQLAFVMFVPQKRGSIANLPPKPKGATWDGDVTAEDRLVYRMDGRGDLPVGHSHIYVLSAEGGTPRQLTYGDFNDAGPISWTKEGDALIFSGNRKPDAEYDPSESEIYEIAVEGVAEPSALTSRVGPDQNPVVSPDGKSIAYIGYDDQGKGFSHVSHLYVMDRTGGNVRQIITTLDRSVSDPRWSANGRGIYFKYIDRGVMKLAYTTLGGAVSDLADIPGGGVGMPYSSGAYSYAQDGGRFAALMGDAGHPADVAIGQQSGSKITFTRLTNLNKDLLDHLNLGTLEPIAFKSAYDQQSIEGWILKPPAFDPTNKYPLVLEIHGGPAMSYGPMFSAEDQIFAALGYVVLYLNPRGSTSYGQKFADFINRDYPHHDYDDLMSGVDAMIGRGYIDPQRLYITGGSGGGVLSAWSVGHTQRFRAAVVVKPVINWYSWALVADMGYTGMKYWMEGYPWENLQRYMERSPISYVANVKTPTMVIHGSVDYRTPLSDAVQFYRALKMLKVPATYVVIPGASHGIDSKPRDYVAKIGYTTGWFACYGGQSVGPQECPYAPARNDEASEKE